MDHCEGFVVDMVTSVQVAPGAMLGLPMSRTHVARGAILGISSNRHRLNFAVVLEIVRAWVITGPAAAVLGLIVDSSAVAGMK